MITLLKAFNQSMKEAWKADKSSLFPGSSVEPLCTRVPSSMLWSIERRLQSKGITVSAYIRDLIKKDLRS